MKLIGKMRRKTGSGFLTQFCSPEFSVEALPHNVTISGERTFGR